MGAELDKVLNDAELQNRLMELGRAQFKAKAEVQRAEALMREVKPVLALDTKYDAAVAELEAEIADIKSVTDNW